MTLTKHFIEPWAMNLARRGHPIVLSGWRDFRLGRCLVRGNPKDPFELLEVTAILIERFDALEPEEQAWLAGRYHATKMAPDDQVFTIAHNGLWPAP